MQYPKLDSVTYTDAAKFLRARYRPMRHLLDTVTDIIRIKQSSTVTALFSFLETKVRRLGHANLTPDSIVSDPLLVAAVMNALKPAIAKRLREDATKLRADYTLAQLKEDALSIESALKDGPTDERRAPGRAAHVVDANPVYEAYVAERGLDRSEVGPRPAYQHAEWYKRDGSSCRYCKVTGHNTAVCNKLYKKNNRGAVMPDSMSSANQAILDSSGPTQ